MFRRGRIEYISAYSRGAKETHLPRIRTKPMDYRFSTLLSPSDYSTDGLCDGIPVRKHIAADLEEIGAFRAQEDWSKFVKPLEGYRGGIGPAHSFMAVSLPECLPERFEIVSYANEFAFLHDGMRALYVAETQRRTLTTV
jgi:hypothetical protein